MDMVVIKKKQKGTRPLSFGWHSDGSRRRRKIPEVIVGRALDRRRGKILPGARRGQW
jgi:hypothetical protein